MEIAPTTQHPNRKVRKRNFPIILYTMLQQIEMEGRFDVVSWSPHGRTFYVHKIDEFEEQVLPRYELEGWTSRYIVNCVCFLFVALSLELLCLLIKFSPI